MLNVKVKQKEGKAMNSKPILGPRYTVSTTFPGAHFATTLDQNHTLWILFDHRPPSVSPPQFIEI